MGKGKTPCCDKSQVKRGPWSPAEDLKLVTFIQKHGHEDWRALPKQAGLLRCGKSCRLRWTNYLRPDVKRGNFTKDEEDTIIKLHQTLGNKWSKISSYLPGRTDNEIKNVWNTHLKKRLVKIGEYDKNELKEYSITTTSSSSSSSSTLVISGNEMDLDVGIYQQRDQGSLTKRISITETDTTMENSERKFLTKEFSSPSISSHSSNLMTDSSQVDVSKPEEDDQIGKILSDFIAQYDVQNALDEVNKLENIGINLLEIPLESDFDFWNTLDTLNSPQSNNEGDNQLQSPNYLSHESSKLGKACINEEDENKKWLRFLKTELGLDTTEDGSEENLFEDNSIYHYQALTSENFDQYDDVPFKPKT